MIKNCSTKRNSEFTEGFTLVELLVVISIISILAGALFMVINPVQLQRKAKEAVLKAKTSQLCLALNACGAVKDDARMCDTLAEIGSSNPNGDPPTATYTLLPSPAAATSTETVIGTLITSGVTCTFTCSFNFNTGDIGKLTKGVNCLTI